MKKQFNKFLILLTALIFGFGQMWAVDPTITVDFTDNTMSNYFKAYAGTGITISTGLTSIGSSSGTYYVDCGTAWDASSSSSTYYFQVASSSGIDSVSFLISGNGSNKTMIPAMLGWGGTYSATSPDTILVHSGVSISNANKASAQWFTFRTSDTIQTIKLVKQFKKVAATIGGTTYASGTTYPSGAQTIRLWGIKVWEHASTSYTVTIDPNGGSYASTPTGWTYSAGVYTKSVAGGSFTPPTGLTNSDKDLSWKDGADNDVNFPVTISADITFVAQWAAHTASSNADLSALSVAGGTLNETFDPATTAYTMTLPFYASMPAVGDVTATKDDANAADPVVSISGNVITIACEAEDNTPKTYTITVSFASTPTASSSINIEQLVLDNGRNWSVVAAALATATVITAEPAGLDSLNDSKAARNYGFLGLKFKKATSKVTVIVPASSVLNVKWGNIATAIKVNVNGVAQSDIATKTDGTSTIYHLDAESYVREVVFYLTVADKTVTLQQVKVGADVDPITLPFLVTYDAGAHGTCATAKEVWTGTALTLPTVTPESGWNFEGWNDDEDNPVSSPYTPTKNITLTAQYSAVASGTDLDALTYTIGAGSPVDVGYSAGTYTYNVVLPYATYPTITVAATPVSGASIKDDATKVLTVTSLPGTATFTVTDGVADQLYTVNFSRLPKDGVSIIKATISGGNAIGEVTGLYKKTASCGGLSSGKFNGKGAYIGLELQDGQTFDENDVINIHTTTAAGQGTIALFDDHGNTVSSFHDYGVMGGVGDNKFDLPAAADTKSIIYVCRTEANTWNGYVDFIEVTRVMNPVLTAIQFNSTDVVVTGTTVAATLPNGTNLGTMTVTPTIAWNGAGTAAVTGSWAWGDNTYVVTDKDGDATTYTINLTEDVVKHTVTFNTHGGSAVASEEVVHNAYLAAAPTAPEKEDYIFQYWSLSDGGAEVDVTTVQIDEDKTFHAVWASDGAIKLLDGATVNHTNFITGVTAEKVTISEVEYDCVKFSGTVSSVSGVKDLTRVIAYNATTNQTKIKLSLYNTSTSSRTVLVKGVVEGSTDVVDLASISLGNKEKKVSDWIEFNNASNRTIYIFISSSAGDVRFLQVKVIEDGATPMKQAGEAGYSLNLNQGRPFGVKLTDIAFEGFHMEVTSDYQPINSTAAKLKSTSAYVTVATPVTMTVTAANAATYYVTEGTAGTDNETALAGASIFDLTAGTWYITAGGSEVQLTSIAFTAPRVDRTITFDSNGGSAVADIVVKDGDVATAPTDPTKDDNDFAGWYNGSDPYDWSAAVTSDLTLTAHWTPHVTNDATLKSLKYGETDITLTDGVYEYNVNLPALTLAVPALTAETNAALATADVTDATDFDGSGQATSTVLVTAEDLSTQLTYTVNFTKAALLPQVDVTATTTWDWANIASENITLTDLKNYECVLANVEGVTNDATFNSQALLFCGERVRNVESARTFATIGHLSFNVTVAGTVRVEFSDNGDNNRRVKINDEQSDASSSKTDVKTFEANVTAGTVTIMGISNDGASTNQYVRISRIEFVAAAAADYTRSGLYAGKIGTLCVPGAVLSTGISGATFFSIAGKNSEGTEIYFAEETELTAGQPYIFEATASEITLTYDPLTPLAASAGNHNGLYGTFSEIHVGPSADIYYISGNKLYKADTFASPATDLTVEANRCYIDITKVSVGSPSPAPGKRYITLKVDGENAATGVDELNASETPVKMIIDGQLFILRGEKLYNANGQLVK